MSNYRERKKEHSVKIIEGKTLEMTKFSLKTVFENGLFKMLVSARASSTDIERIH